MDMTTGADRRAMAVAPNAVPRFWRRAGAVAAIGLIGAAALVLQPLPPDIAARSPVTAAWPELAVKALLALNPALFVAVAALIGAAPAQRAGLRSLVAGTASDPAFARTLARSAGLGLVLGLTLAGVDALMQPHLGEAWQRLVATRPSGASVLAGSMLYGGLAEEVMLRWGVMSLMAWVLLSLAGVRRHRLAMGIAVVLAAVLFAAAHLPVLAAQVELTPLVVARTLLINGVAGLLYGGLFWHRHLEAAMAAHAATHLGLWAWHALTP
jgi:Type II CAAX prenyl endopeptidase Rce1-like